MFCGLMFVMENGTVLKEMIVLAITSVNKGTNVKAINIYVLVSVMCVTSM